MNIILKEAHENGGYSVIQTWEVSAPIPETHAMWPDTLDAADYYTYNGFVILTIETIDGVDTVVSYVPNVEAWEAWKASLPETKEITEQPTQLDRIEAQVTYTAMMTDTMLEV